MGVFEAPRGAGSVCVCVYVHTCTTGPLATSSSWKQCFRVLCFPGKGKIENVFGFFPLSFSSAAFLPQGCIKLDNVWGTWQCVRASPDVWDCISVPEPVRLPCKNDWSVFLVFLFSFFVSAPDVRSTSGSWKRVCVYVCLRERER